MTTIETDYLVIGAGASALAFTDAPLSETDVEVVIVDRRSRPGTVRILRKGHVMPRGQRRPLLASA